MNGKTDGQIAYLVRTIARLEGELVGVECAVRALLISHPDRAKAQKLVVTLIEQMISGALPRPDIDESFLAGVQRAKERVLPSRRDLDERLP